HCELRRVVRAIAIKKPCSVAWAARCGNASRQHQLLAATAGFAGFGFLFMISNILVMVSSCKDGILSMLRCSISGGLVRAIVEIVPLKPRVPFTSWPKACGL